MSRLCSAASESLLLQIERELRNRISSGIALFGGYAFVSARKHYRLKKDSVDLVCVLDREANYITEPVVVKTVDDGHLQRSSHSCCSYVL